MRFFGLLTLYLFSAFSSFAQDDFSTIEPIVNTKVEALTAEDADIVICYYEPCYGYFLKKNPGGSTAFAIKYVMWQNGRKCFIQRFDNCRIYAPTAMDSALITFIQNNYLKIKTAKLKNLAYKIIGNVKDSIQEIYGVDHSCHYIFEIHRKKLCDTIDIDSFPMEALYDTGHPNLNFASNQKNILNELKNLTLREVEYYLKPD
jgi:hypothetical protein